MSLYHRIPKSPSLTASFLSLYAAGWLFLVISTNVLVIDVHVLSTILPFLFAPQAESYRIRLFYKYKAFILLAEVLTSLHINTLHKRSLTKPFPHTTTSTNTLLLNHFAEHQQLQKRHRINFKQHYIIQIIISKRTRSWLNGVNNSRAGIRVTRSLVNRWSMIQDHHPLDMPTGGFKIHRWGSKTWWTLIWWTPTSTTLTSFQPARTWTLRYRLINRQWWLRRCYSSKYNRRKRSYNRCK